MEPLVETPGVFLADLRRKHRGLVALVKRIIELKRLGYDPRGGRTIGLVVPDEIRERIEIQRGKHYIRSYRATVLVAVCLGLVELERSGGSPAVETLRAARRLDPDRGPLVPDEEIDPFPTTIRGVELEEARQEAELAIPDELEGWERDEFDAPKETPEGPFDPEEFSFGGGQFLE